MKLSPSTIAANLSAAAAAEAEIAAAANSNSITVNNQSNSNSTINLSVQSSVNASQVPHHLNQNSSVQSSKANMPSTSTGGNQTSQHGPNVSQQQSGSSSNNQQQLSSGSSNKVLPKDSQVVAAILKEMGIVDFEPRVLPQLVEFAYRYVSRVLEDAQLFSAYARKSMIDADDITLAVQMKIDRTFVGPPPRDILLEISKIKNNQPLPPIKSHNGMRLPADRYSLVAPNLRLASKCQPSSPKGRAGTSLLSSSSTTSFLNSKSILNSPNASGLKNPTNFADTFGTKRKFADV